MTFREKTIQLVLESSVALYVFLGAENDAEFLPLKPTLADEKAMLALRARWPGRGLRWIGVIGLCGATPRIEVNEPLHPDQVNALCIAFLAHLNCLFSANFHTERAQTEIAELQRIYAYSDASAPHF
jgi:hypothetical protein